MWNTERECWKEKEKRSLKIKLKRRKGIKKKQNNQKLRKFGERLNVFFSDRKNVIVTSLFVIIIVIASTCGVVGWKKVNRPKNKEALTTEALSETEKITTTQAETETETEMETETETETETEEEIAYEEFDEMMEEEVPDEDQAPWELPPRTMTSECIPYDGQYREISCWGDSMTYGTNSGPGSITVNGMKKNVSYYSYPQTLQELTGITAYNFGMPGATSDEIAMMQGGLAMKTDRTVTVKDTNEAELRIIRSDNNEFISNDWGFLDDVYILNRPFNVRKTEGWHYISRIYELELNSEVQNSKELVMLSDVKGKDSNAAVIKETEAVEKENPSKETATQKPTTEPATPAYETITIPEGTRVYTKTAIDHSGDILILEIGSNGGWENDYKTLILQYDAMIQEFGCKYYIVVGDTDDPGTSIGDLSQGDTDANGDYIGTGDTSWEAALRLAYGDHFINMRTYLIENGLKDTGIMPTKDDLENYKRGNISKKLRSDWTHLNCMGYYSKGKGIYLKGVELGYWS